MEMSAEDRLYQAVLVEDEDAISQLLSQGKTVLRRLCSLDFLKIDCQLK